MLREISKKISKYTYMSQSVNLILKTTQITNSNDITLYYNNIVTTPNGIISNNRNSFKWNNVNLQLLLGDMYDLYDRFNINLNFIGGAKTGSLDETNINNRCVLVKLSGLPFTSSYNLTNNCNTGQVVLTVIQIPSTKNQTWFNNYFTSQYYTFTKQNIVDIIIDLHTVNSDTTPNVEFNTQMIGHCVFSFNIFGVDKFENINQMLKRVDIPYNGYNNPIQQKNYLK